MSFEEDRSQMEEAILIQAAEEATSYRAVPFDRERLERMVREAAGQLGLEPDEPTVGSLISTLGLAQRKEGWQGRVIDPNAPYGCPSQGLEEIFRLRPGRVISGIKWSRPSPPGGLGARLKVERDSRRGATSVKLKDTSLANPLTRVRIGEGLGRGREEEEVGLSLGGERVGNCRIERGPFGMIKEINMELDDPDGQRATDLAIKLLENLGVELTPGLIESIKRILTRTACERGEDHRPGQAAWPGSGSGIFRESDCQPLESGQEASKTTPEGAVEYLQQLVNQALEAVEQGGAPDRFKPELTRLAKKLSQELSQERPTREILTDFWQPLIDEKPDLLKFLLTSRSQGQF